LAMEQLLNQVGVVTHTQAKPQGPDAFAMEATDAFAMEASQLLVQGFPRQKGFLSPEVAASQLMGTNQEEGQDLHIATQESTPTLERT